ncbi:Hypothetical protein FKW44_022746 [Caligus rogercresseyi]|uniref:Uncharacterized protein n=1 Tax=Caligus rogercresseyi TaxID=217165 RepID=A0A7T8GMW4_CALRO|nr:Hypothetical protein FKW44_022746 [Caligus rogercresseyi]
MEKGLRSWKLLSGEEYIVSETPGDEDIGDDRSCEAPDRGQPPDDHSTGCCRRFSTSKTVSRLLTRILDYKTS